MTLFKYFILTSFFLTTQAICSMEVVEVEGVINESKAKLLKEFTYLSLYNVFPPEGFKNSKLFIDSTLVVSPATINPNVRSLSLKFCGLTDQHIEKIVEFKKLKTLRLSTNHITDQGVKYIAQLTQLESLDLGMNRKITDLGVKDLAEMPQLKILDLSLNKRITDNGIDYLKESKSLEKLFIKSTCITYKKYKEMSQNWNLKEIKYTFSPSE